MNRLAKAIYDRYYATAGATLRGYSTGLWSGIAPDTAVHPFLTFQCPIVDGEDESFDTYYPEPDVQVNVWDDVRSSRRTLIMATLTKALYRNVILTVSGHTMWQARITDGRLIPEPNDDGWHYALTVRYGLTPA